MEAQHDIGSGVCFVDTFFFFGSYLLLDWDIALANVEQWAIDTALDNMARFGYYTQATAGTLPKNQIVDNEQDKEYVMPNRFFDDFVQMACDESKVRSKESNIA